MARAKRAPTERRIARRVVVIRPSPLGRSQAMVIMGATAFPAAIGRNGFTSNKREGDGATPRGRMRLEYGVFRRDRHVLPVSRLPLKPIRDDMGWCDAPCHPLYNRPVRLPFRASHEKLMRGDALYDFCLVLDWNLSCRRRNGGSAIFLHLARPGCLPTEGCVAVSLPAMRRILAYVGTDTDVVVL